MKVMHYLKFIFKALMSICKNRFHIGMCPVCEKKVIFLIMDDWLRDNYRCICCLSIPRQRALKMTLDQVCPDWRNKSIHESSPSGPLSKKISLECSNYIGTQYFPEIPSGIYNGKAMSQNLEQQSFSDQQFDIVITQDVLEHILHPKMAFAEIERTLKPGGIHIFTVPINNKKKTEIRVTDLGGRIEYLKEPLYHKNPVDANGALVVTDWGYDITDVILSNSKMTTKTYNSKNLYFGVDGEFLDVLVSNKAN